MLKLNSTELFLSSCIYIMSNFIDEILQATVRENETPLFFGFFFLILELSKEFLVVFPSMLKMKLPLKH